MRCENSNGAMGSLAMYCYFSKNEKKTWTCNGYFLPCLTKYFSPYLPEPVGLKKKLTHINVND